ncbi:QCR10 [[Candida] subhashii]|uniref:QCR10 n=1 Tax=[Candida] subhashii TaxID=561895 RepID=A0A8J5UEC3_9ASCO|nr:QCR10 [[Candida] subhashii]KAG7661023.1 QCR10 [[Candida] subhashii]
MVAYIRAPVYKTVTNFGKLNLNVIKDYVPNLIFWGGAAGAGVAVFTEGIPLFQTTFYQKIPYFGEHWVYNPDPEDIPL